jgi:hypothetical protein
MEVFLYSKRFGKINKSKVKRFGVKRFLK